MIDKKKRAVKLSFNGNQHKDTQKDTTLNLGKSQAAFSSYLILPLGCAILPIGGGLYIPNLSAIRLTF